MDKTALVGLLTLIGSSFLGIIYFVRTIIIPFFQFKPKHEQCTVEEIKPHLLQSIETIELMGRAMVTKDDDIFKHIRDALKEMIEQLRSNGLAIKEMDVNFAKRLADMEISTLERENQKLRNRR